jgi:pyruvate formate lyase activating enzyme
MKLSLGDVIPMSTLDWPGKVVLAVFMRGCPLNCPYCSNARFIEAAEGGDADVEEVNARVLDASAFVDGVVFSGGEPFMQPAALREMAAYVKGLGLLVGVHTNGAYPERIARLAEDGLLDAVFLDVKAPLEPAAYAAACGGDSGVADAVRRSLALCGGLRREKKLGFLEARTTVFRGVSDTPEAIRRIASAIECADAYVVQQGRPEVAADERLGATEAVPRKELLELGREARQNAGDVKAVKIRTHLFGDEVIK